MEAWPTDWPLETPSTRGQRKGGGGGDLDIDDVTIGGTTSTTSTGSTSTTSTSTSTSTTITTTASIPSSSGWSSSGPPSGDSAPILAPPSSTPASILPIPPTHSPHTSTTTEVVVAPVQPTWQIAVGVIVAIAVIAAITLIIYYCCCRRKVVKGAAGVEIAVGSIIVEEEVTTVLDIDAMDPKFEETAVIIPLALHMAEEFESEQGSEERKMALEPNPTITDVLDGEQATQTEGMRVTPAASLDIDRFNEAIGDNRVSRRHSDLDQAVISEEARTQVHDEGQIVQDATMVSPVPLPAIDSNQDSERSSESPPNAVAQRVKEYECMQAGAARYYETCAHGFAHCGCLETSHRAG